MCFDYFTNVQSDVYGIFYSKKEMVNMSHICRIILDRRKTYSSTCRRTQSVLLDPGKRAVVMTAANASRQYSRRNLKIRSER